MADEAAQAEEKKPEQKTKEPGWHLPIWVRDAARKLLPVVIAALAGGGASLFMDNVANKAAIGSNTFRNTQQDQRLDRMEARLDRMDAHDAQKEAEDKEFQSQVLDRLTQIWQSRRRQ